MKFLLKEEILLYQNLKFASWFQKITLSWLNKNAFCSGLAGWGEKNKKRRKGQRKNETFQTATCFSGVVHWFSVCLCDCWLLGQHIVSYFPLGHSVNFQQLVSVGVLLKIALAIKISGQTVLSNSPLGDEKKSLLAFNDSTASWRTGQVLCTHWIMQHLVTNGLSLGQKNSFLPEDKINSTFNCANAYYSHKNRTQMS